LNVGDRFACAVSPERGTRFDDLITVSLTEPGVALARLLHPHYARGNDEARALLREAFTLSGDIQITGDTLHVRLDPASAPRRSNALAALCIELTDTATATPAPT
jgi:hypothetical protein